jgi:hypothetical protein
LTINQTPILPSIVVQHLHNIKHSKTKFYSMDGNTTPS